MRIYLLAFIIMMMHPTMQKSAQELADCTTKIEAAAKSYLSVNTTDSIACLCE